MDKNFNLKCYIELLEKKDRLKETEAMIIRELRSYRVIVGRQISYNRKDEYFSLIREYLVKKMNPDKFRAKFLQMEQEDDFAREMLEQDFKKLSCFLVDVNLRKKKDIFFSLINLIYDISMLAIEFGPDYGIS